MMLEYLNRVIIGGWQLSTGHSDTTEGLKVVEAYYEAGFRTFDCADIYTGVEDLLGSFVKTHGLRSNDIHIHTKYVPDMASLASLTKDQTTQIIDRSRERLGLETLDLVQFHWWHYPTGNYLAALDSLYHLKQEGKLKEIGLTNFDAAHLQDIINQGIPIASIQTQYSIIDRRATKKLEPLMKQHDIALLCYGSVAGGLLSDGWLGTNEPQEPFENRSLVKYKLMVQEMGGWEVFQTVLQTLRAIADAYDTDIASIASAYCLSQSSVKACIVGARNSKHLKEHVQLRNNLTLSESDLVTLQTLRETLPNIPGDVYALERDVNGKHGRIMKYNLNKS